MFATGDYNRFYCDVMERYSDVDIPITFGILIADYDQQMAREHIINYLDVFNETSGKYIDFLFRGMCNMIQGIASVFTSKTNTEKAIILTVNYILGLLRSSKINLILTIRITQSLCYLN